MRASAKSRNPKLSTRSSTGVSSEPQYSSSPTRARFAGRVSQEVLGGALVPRAASGTPARAVRPQPRSDDWRKTTTCTGLRELGDAKPNSPGPRSSGLQRKLSSEVSPGSASVPSASCFEDGSFWSCNVFHNFLVRRWDDVCLRGRAASRRDRQG